MIKKVINVILNKLISPTKRYNQTLVASKSSKFLSSFSISESVKTQENRLRIGGKCLIGAKFIFETNEGRVEIGDRVYIGASTIICKSNIQFGNDILVAWGVMFYDHDSHSIDHLERQADIRQVLLDYNEFKGNFLARKNWSVVNSSPIVVQDNVWIGMDSLILKGVTIGEGAIVAARSVVTKDVPPFTIVAGNPAKVVKELSRT